MSVLDISPTVAWRICDQVSVGLGLDLYYGRMEFREAVPFSDGGSVRASGDGYAVGANVGVTWQITERQRLALTCRSPFDLRFEGDGTAPGYESDFGGTFFFPTIVPL